MVGQLISRFTEKFDVVGACWVWRRTNGKGGCVTGLIIMAMGAALTGAAIWVALTGGAY